MFTKGQTVRLRSGGPTMTVDEVGTIDGIENAARCVWFNDKNELQNATFGQALLKNHETDVVHRVNVSRRRRSE